MVNRSSRGRKQSNRPRRGRQRGRQTYHHPSRNIDFVELVRTSLRMPLNLQFPSRRGTSRTSRGSRSGPNRESVLSYDRSSQDILDDTLQNFVSDLPVEHVEEPQERLYKEMGTNTNELAFEASNSTLISNNNEENVAASQTSNFSQLKDEAWNETDKIGVRNKQTSGSNSSVSAATTNSSVTPTSHSNVLETSSSAEQNDYLSLPSNVRLFQSFNYGHGNSESGFDNIIDVINGGSENWNRVPLDTTLSLAEADHRLELEDPSEVLLQDSSTENTVTVPVESVNSSSHAELATENPDTDEEACGDGHHNDTLLSIEITITDTDSNSDGHVADAENTEYDEN